ncbi:eukaryotic cytochrome b561-domain-containing protein [Mycotypha africana]|uniref:eukaryotic cytochrome b561-domain-containing protein n=1 Tax=Mycotypha africana TaxID=64632 RepID=UPI00230059EA|nr:eukaryotic cytochrome b561-domain-containing protein [Mycotypha africana]KAI8979091.1 eukaryotic cytochrome b561-domain-containing protein [Mycotypha africana]
MSVAHGSIVFGLILFIALILSVLVRLPSFSLFSYHPTFMTAFLVCITEGVALLQPTPATVETKQKGFRWHLLVQVLGSGCLLIGFLCIFYNKQLHNKPHFQSFHGQMGLTIFIYVWLQAIFGVIMALIPRYVFGSVERGKQLWKYHRMTGYVLLLVVWITAQLGVRTDYMLANLINTNLLYLHWIVLVLVIAGLFYRFRIHKIGF